MYSFQLSDLLLTYFELSDIYIMHSGVFSLSLSFFFFFFFSFSSFFVFQFRHRIQNNRPTVADKPKIHALGATGAFSRLHAKLTGVGCWLVGLLRNNFLCHYGLFVPVRGGLKQKETCDAVDLPNWQIVLCYWLCRVYGRR